jgi:hypothetical protein
MTGQGENDWSRRAAVILGLKSELAAAEPPLETNPDPYRRCAGLDDRYSINKQ